MANALVEFWSAFAPSEPPHIHPADAEYLEQSGRTMSHVEARDFGSFIRSPDFGKWNGRFHLSLLPAPYLGDLDRADIFLLLINPGVALQSYLEQADGRYLELWERTIHQRLDGTAFPNYTVDPANAWCGAYQWWEKKFRRIACELVQSTSQPSYMSALREISRRVAAIELNPYHSISRPNLKPLAQLPSTIAARKFVASDLLPRAAEGRAIVVVTRARADWGIDGNVKGVHVYDNTQARSASFSLPINGKAPILDRLRSWPP
ncbi:hypothetical protein [Albidovulum sp.]|uniref:hypothetical protein n=1 Tax=Albidovulum sp. TaxID=1872424 RepID=UPI0039B82948